MRLDVWLWSVRIYKTRTVAADAIKAGHVRIGGQSAKPSREVREGDLIEAEIVEMTRTVKVRGFPKSRVGAKLVAEFVEELTPPEEFEKRRREPNLLPPGFRPRGTGRPTKRDRRELDDLGL